MNLRHGPDRLVYYRAQPRGMKPLIDWSAHYRAVWTEHVDRLERLLEKWTDDSHGHDGHGTRSGVALATPFRGYR